MKNLLTYIFLMVLLLPASASAQQRYINDTTLEILLFDSARIANTVYKQPPAYFIALHHVMKNAFAEARRNNHFTDTLLLEHIQRGLAYHHLEALNAQYNGDSVSFAWRATLDTATCKNCTYLQHLALSTNAHLNHDLYFILVDFYKKYGTANHDYKKACKEVFTVSTQQTDRIISTFIAHSSLSWFERQEIKVGKVLLKRLMKQTLGNTFKNAVQAARHPEKEPEITAKQIRFVKKNIRRFLCPRFPVKQGFNALSGLNALPFETKIKMLKPD